MRLGTILYTLGYGGSMLSLLMVLPWMVSLFDPQFEQTGTFTVGLVLCFFISGALLLTGFSSRRHRTRGIELLIIMVLYWSILPILASVPFISAVQIDGPVPAYFEAVSALTTSGGSVLVVPEAEQMPVLLWRALLSWLGGLWTLVFAVAVLAPFGIGGITLIGSPLLQHEEEATLSSRLGRPLRLIAPLYAGFTALGFIVLLLVGTPRFDAVCLALSAISTSGLTTQSGSLGDLVSTGGLWTVAAMNFVGAISIPLLLVATWGRRIVDALREIEFRVFCGLIVGYALISYLALPELTAGFAILQAIGLHTTAGFNFLPNNQLNDWPLVWTMMPVLIGGMAMSTAGGLKVMRAIILAKDLGSEVGRLAYPSSIHPLSLEGRRLEEGDFTAAWAFTAVFILFVTLGIVLLGLFGITLTHAWPIVLGALSNSLAITNHLTMPLGYGAMSSALQIIIALLMIAGRIELLILMVLFTSSFWRFMR